jgi:hypothetical protein
MPALCSSVVRPIRRLPLRGALVKPDLRQRVEPRFAVAPELYSRRDVSGAMEHDVALFEERYAVRFDTVLFFTAGGFARLHAADETIDGQLADSAVLERPPAADVADEVRLLTDIANRDQLQPAERVAYFEALSSVYRKLPSNPSTHEQNGSVLFVGVEREGRILADSLGCLPVGHSVTPHAKRIGYQGGLLVGVTGLEASRLYEGCTIIDGAIASGATLITMMHGLKHVTSRFHVFSVHATVQGLRAILRYALDERITVRLSVGHVTSGLNDHFYAVLPDQPSKVVVGDLGDTIWPVKGAAPPRPARPVSATSIVEVAASQERADSRWQQRRAALNHDWLKNHLLVGLAEWQNVLAGHVDRDVRVETFLTAFGVEWRERRQPMRELLAQCEAAMSPRVLCDSPPLAGLPAAQRRWLGDTVHALWVTRSAIRRLIDDAAACLEKADDCFEQMSRLGLLSPDAGEDARQPHRVQVTTLYERMNGLARAIERLPSRITVV